MSDDVDHPILERPWEWTIIKLAFADCGEVEVESIIDLVVRRNGVQLTLRFSDITDFRLQPPFPRVSWLQIRDIRGRGLEGLRVLVCDGEMGEPIHFYAHTVRLLSPTS